MDLPIPEWAREDVVALLELDVSELARVNEELASLDALKRGENAADRVADALKFERDRASAIVSAVRNLRRFCEVAGRTASVLVADLSKAFGVELSDAKSAALVGILESEAGHIADKVHRLRMAGVPHLVSSSSVCDLRPVFDKEHNNIAGALLVCLLELRWHDTDHESHSLTLQMDREDIGLLRKTLEDAEAKLQQIDAKLATVVDIFK